MQLDNQTPKNFMQDEDKTQILGSSNQNTQVEKNTVNTNEDKTQFLGSSNPNSQVEKNTVNKDEDKTQFLGASNQNTQVEKAPITIDNEKTQLLGSSVPNPQIEKAQNNNTGDKTQLLGSTIPNSNVNKANLPNTDEKTIVQKSSFPKFNVGKDSTIFDSEKTQFKEIPKNANMETNNVKNAEKPVSETNQPNKSKLDELKEKSSEKNASSGWVAAAVGVAAAGAGVALGTAYSDEIKTGLGIESTDAPESPEADAHDTKPGSEGHETTDGNNPINASYHGGIPVENHNSPIGDHHQSTLEFSSTDDNGNIYTASLIDSNGDGTFDTQSANIQMVDGSIVTYTETGDKINPIFDNGNLNTFGNLSNEFAEPIHTSYPIETGSSGQDTHIYTVHAGDTLSEIAGENHTSIEHIMELNPEITDPNLIYTGNTIEIPDNDHISNPYEHTHGNYTEHVPIMETTDHTGGGFDIPENDHNAFTNYGINSDPFIIDDQLVSNNDEPFEISNEPISDNGDNEFYHSSDNNDHLVIGDDVPNEVSNGEFAEVDWASFSDDAPITDQDAYGEALSNTDFDSWEASDSNMDLGSSDYGNNDVVSDFL